MIAPLRLSPKDENRPVWLNTPFIDLVIEAGAVAGVVAEKDGKPARIHANKVVLAMGSFVHNQQLREEFQQGLINQKRSSASSGNLGDAIQLGLEAGAKIDLMEDA